MFKKIKNHFNHRFNRFYRRSRMYMIVDIVLIAVVIILAALLLRLYAYQPEISLAPWTDHVHKKEIDLNNPPLDLSYQIKNHNIYWDEGVNLTLRLKNNKDYLLKNININFISQSDSFSLSRIEFSDFQKTSLSGVEISGFDINLNELSSGTDREINLLVYFKKENNSSRTIEWRFDSEYEALGQLIKESSALDTLKITSDLSASASAYYNSPQGDQLGSGPFPPISDIPTKIWIFFETEAPADFKNFIMSGKLAQNVEFAGNESLLSGNLNYNSDAKQLVWQIDEITSGDVYRAGFEVEINPTKDQVGDYADLVNSIKFQAIDYFTGLPVSGNLSDIDTSLKNDVINKEEGKVIDIDSL